MKQNPSLEEKLRLTIANIPDFPIQGVMFRDISPVLADNVLCKEVLNTLHKKLIDLKLDGLAGIESRGFIFGRQLAEMLDIPFIMLRKPGKLPGELLTEEYKLEYGMGKLQMQKHAFAVIKKEKPRIGLHDDLIATGGSGEAGFKLIERGGGIPAGSAFLVQLRSLGGGELLAKYGQVFNLIEY